MGKAAPSLLDLASTERRRPGKPSCAVVAAVSTYPTIRPELEALMRAMLDYSTSAPAAARGCAKKAALDPSLSGLLKLTGQVFQHHRNQQCAYCAAAGLPVVGES